MSRGRDAPLKLPLPFLEPQRLSSPFHFPSQQVNKDNKLEWAQPWFVCSWGAAAPVQGVGPICTVTSRLAFCLKQEVELQQSGLGYCTPGRKCAYVLRVRMSISCCLGQKWRKCKSEWVLGDVCRCNLLIVLVFGRWDHIDSLSIKGRVHKQLS